MKKVVYLLLSVLMAYACLLVSGCKKQLPSASLYVSLDPAPEAWQGPVCINSENDGLELTIPYDGVPRMLAIRCEFYSEAYGKYVQPVEATRWMSVTYENGETSKYISWREEPVLERGRYIVSIGIRGEDYGIASDHLTLYLSVA